MSILQKAFVIYYDDFIDLENADKYFSLFNTTFDFKYNNFNGHKLNRQTCAFANKELLENEKTIPKIWGNDITVNPWTPELLEIKEKVEKEVFKLTGVDWKYNIALCNRYTKKSDFIAFHSDREELGNTKSISSISLGIPRTFHYISNDSNEKLSIVLDNGSFIFMGDDCQENYKHGMKKEDLTRLTDSETLKKYNNTRINITFRVWNY